MELKAKIENIADNAKRLEFLLKLRKISDTASSPERLIKLRALETELSNYETSIQKKTFEERQPFAERQQTPDEKKEWNAVLSDLHAHLNSLLQSMDSARAEDLLGFFEIKSKTVFLETSQREEAEGKIKEWLEEKKIDSDPFISNSARLLLSLCESKPSDKSLLVHFKDEIQAAWLASGAISAWLSDSRRTSEEISALSNLLSSDSLPKDYAKTLSKIGFDQNLFISLYSKTGEAKDVAEKRNRRALLEHVFLRNYGVSSAGEFAELLNKNIAIDKKISGLSGGTDLSRALSAIFQLQKHLEDSRLLEFYTGDKLLFNGKFNDLDIVGKFFFLSKTLPMVQQGSADTQDTIDILLSDGKRLGGAGQLLYFGDSAPSILGMFSDIDSVAQLSNAISGTAIVYGRLYGSESLGQKKYLGEVSERIDAASAAFLSQFIDDMKLVKQEEVLKLRTPEERIFSTAQGLRGISPSELRLFQFSNVVANAYLMATSGGDPIQLFREFFSRGPSEMIPERAPPRRDTWYAPSIDALLRELTRIDIQRHLPNVFNRFDGSVFANHEEWNDVGKTPLQVDLGWFGQTNLSISGGSNDAFASQKFQGFVTALAQDLRTSENWTVQSLNAGWSRGVNDERLNGALNAYGELMGENADILVFTEKQKRSVVFRDQSESFTLRAYARRGNTWVRFFQEENQSRQDLEMKYGRAITPNADIRSRWEQGEVSGFIAGVNSETAGIALAESTPRAAFGQGLGRGRDSAGGGFFKWEGGLVSLKAFKVEEKNQYSFDYVTEPFILMGAGGRGEGKKSVQWAADVGYKSDSFYIRADLMDLLRYAYTGQDYSRFDVSTGQPTFVKGEYTPRERITGASGSIQKDWGERSLLFFSGNSLSRQVFDDKTGAYSERQRDEGFVSGVRIRRDVSDVKIKGEAKRDFLGQISYYFNPYSHLADLARGRLDALKELDQNLDRQLKITSLSGARSEVQFQRERIRREITVLEDIIYENMMRTLKLKCYLGQDFKALAEAAVGSETAAYSGGVEVGSVSLGGSLLQDLNRSGPKSVKAVGLEFSKILENGQFRASIAVPTGSYGKGYVANAGLSDLHALGLDGIGAIASYTSLDLAAKALVDDINGNLPSLDPSARSKIRGEGFAFYKDDPNKRWFIVATKNSATGKTDFKVTDSELEGLDAGGTVYWFTKTGLRGSVTASVFGENVKIKDVITPAEANVPPNLSMFEGNRFGLTLNVFSPPQLSVQGSAGYEQYKTESETYNARRKELVPSSGKGKGAILDVKVTYYF